MRMVKCSTCKGRGNITVKCHICGQTGWIAASKNPDLGTGECKRCDAQGEFTLTCGTCGGGKDIRVGGAQCGDCFGLGRSTKKCSLCKGERKAFQTSGAAPAPGLVGT